MKDPVAKLFDPEAGALTPEEENALCQTLARIQREADEDEQSPRVRRLITRVDEIVNTSLDKSSE